MPAETTARDVTVDRTQPTAVPEPLFGPTRAPRTEQRWPIHPALSPRGRATMRHRRSPATYHGTPMARTGADASNDVPLMVKTARARAGSARAAAVPWVGCCPLTGTTGGG